MRALLLIVVLSVLLAAPAFAQSDTEEKLRRVVPYSEVLGKFPGLSLSEYDRVVRQVAQELESQRAMTVPAPPTLPLNEAPTFGSRSGNTYRWNTTINPDGSMRVFDSNLNTWKFDAASNTYMNFDTGTICVGSRSSRICTS